MRQWIIEFMIVIKLFLIFLPTLMVAAIHQFDIVYRSEPSANAAYGLVLLYTLLFAAPLIAIIGLLTSRYTKTKPRAKFFSLLGYLAPSALACVYLLTN